MQKLPETRWPKLSVIVTTYNWPTALEEVLEGLQIIIADDGSTPDTQALINIWQQKKQIPIHHVWQPDDGFQAAKIRNKAIVKASHPYLVFLDGDCVPRKHFIQHHKRLAEKNYWVAGNRILLSQTAKGQHWADRSLWQWAIQRLKKNINRWLPLITLPLGPLRKLQPSRWQGAKTCNLAAWKSDIFQINGFDEAFMGWGYEDSDLVTRLIKHHIHRKEGRFATTVIHLWHPEAPRTQAEHNWQKFSERLKTNTVTIKKGIQQYV